MILELTPDELLSTTRAVRKRFDLTRPVEPEVIRECVELAVQAPTPGGQQTWHFIVVTDPAKRKALADVYRKGARFSGQKEILDRLIAHAANEQEAAHYARMAASALGLTAGMQDIPVLVVPCIQGRAEHLTGTEQATFWSGILPATWSFMLAARSRGLGTVLTTIHLDFEQDAAEVLGIPYEDVTQVALIPLAYTLGTDFKPAGRKPLDQVLHWDRW